MSRICLNPPPIIVKETRPRPRRTVVSFCIALFHTFSVFLMIFILNSINQSVNIARSIMKYQMGASLAIFSKLKHVRARRAEHVEPTTSTTRLDSDSDRPTPTTSIRPQAAPQRKNGKGCNNYFATWMSYFVKKTKKFVYCGIQILVIFLNKVNLYEFKGKTCYTAFFFHFNPAIQEAQHPGPSSPTIHATSNADQGKGNSILID
jgi:hypothetical protein